MTNTNWNMTTEEREALTVIETGFLPTTSTTAGDRYIDPNGARFYIDKEVPRCQAMLAYGGQCTRRGADFEGTDPKTGEALCTQHAKRRT